MTAFLMNADEDLLRERIIDPWLIGKPMVIEGRQFPDPTKVTLRIIRGPTIERGRTPTDTWIDAVRLGEDVTDEYIREPPGSRRAPTPEREPKGDPRKVMVVHGRDEVVRTSIFQILRALSLEPLEWSTLVALTGTPAPYIGQVLDKAFDTARAAVVVLSPDEEVRLRAGLRGADDPDTFALQSRPNVFLEAGLALGRFPEQTVILEVGRMRAASDLEGRHNVRIDAAGDWRHDLADRLEQVGCHVDRSGRDWLKIGDFEEAFAARPGHDDPSQRNPSPADQERLDRLLSVLSRPAMRTIRAQDFGTPWPEDMTYPVDFFLNELEGIEQHFDDPSLDELRASLRETALAFVEAEAWNGFDAKVPDRRNTGWPSGELETDPEAFKVAETRRQEIHQAAIRFTEAHDNLVRAAKQKGQTLGAIETPALVPPWRTDPYQGAQRLEDRWRQQQQREHQDDT